MNSLVSLPRFKTDQFRERLESDRTLPFEPFGRRGPISSETECSHDSPEFKGQSHVSTRNRWRVSKSKTDRLSVDDPRRGQHRERDGTSICYHLGHRHQDHGC